MSVISYVLCRFFYQAYVLQYNDYCKNKLIKKEQLLAKRIWDLEYNKKKDTELNYLFFSKGQSVAIRGCKRNFQPRY